MKAIIGLGNPGEEYANTRHNAGFNVIDVLGEKLGASYWKDECGAFVAHCKSFLFNEEILLVKPQSFMNVSGSPVKNLVKKYNLNIDDLIIVHDDMDISSTNIRIKRGGGNAGHNGLKSIDAKLGSNNYIRLRVGIDKAPGKMPHADYVLGIPKGRLALDFKENCLNAAEAALFLLNHTLEQAQQEYNKRN